MNEQTTTTHRPGAVPHPAAEPPRSARPGAGTAEAAADGTTEHATAAARPTSVAFYAPQHHGPAQRTGQGPRP